MKKNILLALIPLLGFAFILVGFNTPPNPENKKVAAAKINWISIEEAVAAAEKDGKKIIIDMYTDWCGWCKRMDRDTYSKAEIINYINDNYHAVKFNAEQKEAVTLKGKTYKYVPNGRRGYHELAAAVLNGRLSYPSTVFFDSQFKLLTNVPGYQKPKDMLVILNYLGEDAYRNTPFQTYKQNFTGK
jgi:thioredoxin-related protein